MSRTFKVTVQAVSESADSAGTYVFYTKASDALDGGQKIRDMLDKDGRYIEMESIEEVHPKHPVDLLRKLLNTGAWTSVTHNECELAIECYEQGLWDQES